MIIKRIGIMLLCLADIQLQQIWIINSIFRLYLCVSFLRHYVAIINGELVSWTTVTHRFQYVMFWNKANFDISKMNDVDKIAADYRIFDREDETSMAQKRQECSIRETDFLTIFWKEWGKITFRRVGISTSNKNYTFILQLSSETNFTFWKLKPLENILCKRGRSIL